MVAEGGEKTVAPPLYGRMMRAIRTGHSIGNTIRILKLPLVFKESLTTLLLNTHIQLKVKTSTASLVCSVLQQA